LQNEIKIMLADTVVNVILTGSPIKNAEQGNKFVEITKHKHNSKIFY
jgi:hypothetical protein